MTPGEALVARIADYVKTLVEPDQVEPVTKATAQAVAILMNDPIFTGQLRIVNELQQENQWLKSQVTQLQRAVVLVSQPVKVARPRKKAAPKKAAAKPSTRIQGTASRSAKAAFLQGKRQAKR